MSLRLFIKPEVIGCKEVIEMGRLTREVIKTGGTNPDYPATLCESITAEVKRKQWDTRYMVGKAKVLIEFLEYEQRRADSLAQQEKEEQQRKKNYEREVKERDGR